MDHAGMPLQYSVSAALEAAGGKSGTNVHLLILPQP
jgi:hypothetical protein